MAQTAERGLFDAVLLSPAPGALRLDTLALLGSLIAVTGRIGLAAHWSVDHAEPFHVARVFATLDHLAHGRTAWIAGLAECEPAAAQFGHATPLAEPATYWARAAEFIDATQKLWDSWEDEAFIADVPSGRFAEPSRVHPVHFAGDYFTIRGPLNVPRPPQGQPVLIQTDTGMPEGRLLAAHTADILLIAPQTLAEGQNLTANMKACAMQLGRDLRVLADIAPGISAETLVAWLQAGACDGFNLRPENANDLSAFVDSVVPALQRRGLFRTHYDGDTLRAHLRLARPRSQFAT